MSAKLDRIGWLLAASLLSFGGLVLSPAAFADRTTPPATLPQISTTAAAEPTPLDASDPSVPPTNSPGWSLENGELMIGGASAAQASGTEWVAYIPITNYDNSGSICTGVLVDPSWVLTAKHCLANSPHYINVSFGANRLGSYPVDDYKTNLDFDAALLHLKTPVAGIAPARLAKTPANIGDVGIEYGWGGTGTVLQNAQQRIVATCFAVVGKDDPSKFTANCSGSQAPGQLSYKVQWSGVKTEHGDSGGPLVVNGQVVGTLIGGNDEASYFGSVGPLAGWLQEIAKVSLGGSSMNVVEYPFESRLERIAGQNRVATALALHGASGASGDAIVLTTGNLAPDALSSAALVGARGATILLSTTSPVESSVVSAIKASGRKQVYVVGGGVKLSPAQRAELGAAGIAVEDLVGLDRFDTAAKVALLAQGLNAANSAATPENILDVFLVDATSDPNIPDAIAAGPAVAERRGVILFTNGTSLPETTIDAISTLSTIASQIGGTLRIWGVGGRAATAVPGALIGGVQLGVNIVGADRYETATKLADDFFPNAGSYLVASGTVFADGLAGAGYAHASKKAILLTAPNQLNASLEAFVKAHPSATYTIAGGDGAVSRFVANSIGALLAR